MRAVGENLGELLDTLRQLVRQPSVTSAEHPFLRVLQRELEEAGARVRWYEGLLVAEGLAPSSCYLSAHIDRHGLICTGPGEFQYAAFIARNRSDLEGNSVSERSFTQITERFVGKPVYAYEPWSGVYAGQGAISSTTLCPRTGAMLFQVTGLEHLVAGTPVAFRDNVKRHGERVAAQLDNVVSAAAIVHLFRRGYAGTAFFTAEEEAGRSWRYLLEYCTRFGVETRSLLVLDTSPYATDEDADAQALVLRRRDVHSAFEPATVQQLAEQCQQLKIRYGYKDDYIEAKNRERAACGKSLYSLGVTELGRLAAAAGGRLQGATVQLPTTGYHTTDETCSLSSLTALLTLLEYTAQARGAWS